MNNKSDRIETRKILCVYHTDDPKSPGPVELEETVPGTLTVCWSPSPDEKRDDRLHYMIAKRDSVKQTWHTQWLTECSATASQLSTSCQEENITSVCMPKMTLGSRNLLNP